ncbi:uncharacterized protein LOC129302467 isoform X1 [Prosopis cineraria]|uniref:uncharacterized protein LOC129302467 isoform X1 n=3 Tax=Prosopis cineraria TaxID=364024 RepID=UPI00240F30C8|nr:uncharacterized protein LOC129302467 isoform X1 [Prosopis cineraria]XP_054797354.1 uncharacterized protein LOC129302467 isoform X1 [Prosopis cineraria]XP_054797355.1 uncharacterized protein LOC129302467 isoform X1 [Prosopis cineraria]
MTEQPRIVKCPKCRQLLPEYSHYTVYMCGGCGTTLQAKKRKKEAANRESCEHKTDAAPRNVVNLASEDKECSNIEQPALPQENVVRSKPTSSSSEECSLEGDGGSNQIENGECRQLVLLRENAESTKRTSSFSGECSLDGDSGSNQNENGECNADQLVLVLPQEEIVIPKRTNSSSGHCSSNINGVWDQSEDREYDEKKLALPQQNVLRAESTSSSSGEHPLDVNAKEEFNGKQLVLPEEKVQKTKPTSSSSGEYSLDVNDKKDQIRNEESNVKKLVLPNGSKADSLSSACLDENGSKEQSSNGECNEERLDLPHENIQRTESTGFSSGECSLDEIGGRDQNENGEFNVAFSLSDEEMEKETNVNNLSRGRFKQHKVSNDGCSTELTETKIEASSVLMGGESSEGETTDTQLQLARAAGSDNRNLVFQEAKEQLIGASDGVDAKNDESAQIEAEARLEINRSDNTAKSLTDDNSASGKGSTSGNPVSSHDKQMKQGQEPKPYTFDNSEVMNQSSELSGDLGELSKSPTTRSYHAYDGSVSSYDEMDKQFPDQHLKPFENNYNATNVVSEGRHRKGKGPVNSLNVPPDLPRGKHHVMKDTKRSQYEALETTRRDRPARHRMRAGTENYPPRMPYHRSGLQSSYGSDTPSNQVPDDEHYFSSSSLLSPDYCEDSDQEKLNLLIMIHKLQNQLRRTSSLKGDTTERLFPGVSYKGDHVSSSRNHEFREGRRFSHDLSDPWCDARYFHGPINWRQRSKIPPIPFSAEATSSTHHVDNSCFHCQHKEWRYSADLPPHALFQLEQSCKYHPGHNNCCFPHRSYPFNAPRYISSKLQLYGHETKSNDQRHRAHEMRMYFREKQNMNKKHFRPVAGGAPFITCRNCFKLLQLPADFLLFKRVCHQLKCGHCSEILKFSLQDRSHIVSYDPSRHGDQSEVINGSNQLASSASRANYFHSSHVVPISFSDDYGNYVSKSYSSGGDPVSLTSFHPLHGSECDTNVSCAFEEEDKIASRHARTSNTPVRTNESTVVSSNMSGSEAETVPPPRSSPLHQLMGYSSPSQVIRGIQSHGNGNELMKNEHDYS